MPVFGNKQTLDAVKADYAYIFEKERYPGVPEIVLHYIENRPFFFNNDKIIPIQVHHYKNPVFGYRINNIIYITDAKAIPSEEMNKLLDCNILIINALRIQPHYSHLNLKETLDIIETVKPKRAFITHISHQMGLSESVKLPENVSLAYDGMKISDI
jgi:phosphoribosyl 1,2-cyclic phosphate phosphodiesterase